MSQLFQWDPAKYSVHVDAMDREHQQLIEIMNRLHARHSEGAPASALKPIVAELGSFTQKHFADEERYMESIGWSRLGQHKLIHQELLSRFQRFAAEFEKTDELSDEFFIFLRSWLSAHIQGVDRKYGEPSARKSA